MNKKQQNLLIAHGLPEKEPLNYLVGRQISFMYDKERRTLLITEARDTPDEILISFFACYTYHHPGFLGLSISPTGKLQLILPKVQLEAPGRIGSRRLELEDNYEDVNSPKKFALSFS